MMKLELSDGTWELKRKTSKANERERERKVGAIPHSFAFAVRACPAVAFICIALCI